MSCLIAIISLDFNNRDIKIWTTPTKVKDIIRRNTEYISLERSLIKPLTRGLPPKKKIKNQAMSRIEDPNTIYKRASGSQKTIFLLLFCQIFFELFCPIMPISYQFIDGIATPSNRLVITNCLRRTRVNRCHTERAKDTYAARRAV